MQESASESCSKAKDAPITNDDMAVLFEAKLMAAAKECRRIVQRCLREEEWHDAEEAIREVLCQYFANTEYPTFHRETREC